MKKKQSKLISRYDGDETINMMARALTGLDRLIAEGVGAASKEIGRQPTCRSCTKPGCCSQYVLVTLFEAIPLAREVLRDGRDTPFLRRSLERVGERQEAAGVDGWWQRAQPCPLLRRGHCSVYAVRPAMCRGNFSWSPVALCQPPAVMDITTVELAGVKSALMRMNLELLSSLGLTDGRAYCSSLPRMLAIALRLLDLDTTKGVEFLRSQRFPLQSQLARWLRGSGAEVELEKIASQS